MLKRYLYFISKKQTRFILPLIILLAAIFLRFYRLSDLLYFMIDEERYAFLMKRIYLDHKLALVGVAIPSGIYLGPAYFYFTGLLQLMFNFNPAALGAIASLTGIMATLGIFYLTKKFFGVRVAIMAIAVYAFSYLIVIYNRIYWTLTWSSITALLTYWGLYQIITAKKYWYLYPLTFFYILGSHSDAGYFSLIITAIIILCSHFRHLPKKTPLLISATVFIAAQLPILVFDFRHDFYNTKLIWRLITNFTSPGHISVILSLKSLLIFPQTLSRLLMINPPYDITYQLSPTETTIALRQQAIHPILILLSSLILIVFLIKSWNGKPSLIIKILKTHLLVALTGVLLYSLVFPGYIHEWFLTVLFPALSLTIALVADLLIRRSWGWLIIPTLLLMLVRHSQALLKTDNAFGFGPKRQAVQYAISQVGSRPFFLDAVGSQAYGGYRFLFWLYGREPVHSFMDNLYGNWIYPMPSPDTPTDLGVIMVSLSDLEGDRPSDLIRAEAWRRQALASQKFAGIEVLVVPTGAAEE